MKESRRILAERFSPVFAGILVVTSMGVPPPSGAMRKTISPSLSEQFGALVNLAVVTNVIPYILALSALPVMMKAANVPSGVFTRNMVITVVAMLYSVYALYASGGEAVMGGMLVLGVTYVIWGFISNRFKAPGSAASTL